MNESVVLRLGLGGLLLAATVAGEVVTAQAKNDYEIINTGIKGGGCWYDDSHFIIVKGQQPAPGREFEMEGLYYLDPNRPKDLVRIDLSPLEPSQQQQIRDVSCQEETILFDVMAPDRKTTRLYGLKIAQQPELLADLRWATAAGISLKGRFVLGNKLTVDSGVWEEHTDCDVKTLKSGLKVLCWPRDTIGQWVTPQFVVHEYLWREAVWVRDQHGNRERVQNPKSPLKLPDGTEFKQGYLLRDLENRIVQEIPMKQAPYQVVDFQPDPRGMYLYGVCYKAGDHGERHLTVGGRICRFRLDGKSTKWEEVVAVQQSPDNVVGLHQLQANEREDLVALQFGRGVRSIWKYTAATQRVDKVRHVSSKDNLGGIRLSPTGRWMSFSEQGTLHFAQERGIRP